MSYNQDVYTLDVSAWSSGDYVTVLNPTLTFEPNFLSQDVTITMADDLDLDADEYFEICLTNPTGGDLGAPLCSVVVVKDDKSGGRYQ